MIKFAGEVFGGSTLALGSPVEFGTNTMITMKVFANRVDAPVTFKLEGPVPVELTSNTTVANEWEVLSYDFSGSTEAVYTGITIIYDLGVVGDGSADFTMLFDDIRFPGGVAVKDLGELGVDYFPNPVSDQMTINAPNAIEFIEVFNMVGQNVYRERTADQIRNVDLSNLTPGTYFLRITIDGEVGTGKFIKQ